MGFFRQEYWSGVPFSFSGDHPDPGVKPMSLASPALAGRVFTSEPSGSLLAPVEPYIYRYIWEIQIWQHGSVKRVWGTGKDERIWLKGNNSFSLYNRSFATTWTSIKMKCHYSINRKIYSKMAYLAWCEILITWHKKVLGPDLGWFFFLMLYICTWFFYYNNLLKLHVLNLLITLRMYNKHTLNS